MRRIKRIYTTAWRELSGTGQVAANTLGAAGQNYAGLGTNTLLGSAYNIGQAYQNAAYQRAAGTAANAAIWGGALTNSLAALGPSLAQLFQQPPVDLSGISIDPTGNLYNPVPGSY